VATMLTIWLLRLPEMQSQKNLQTTAARNMLVAKIIIPWQEWQLHRRFKLTYHF